MVLTHRANDYQSLSPRVKTLIKCLRVVQLVLRVLQLIGAAGILTLYILMTNVPTAAAWVLRIAVSISFKFHPTFVLTIGPALAHLSPELPFSTAPMASITWPGGRVAVPQQVRQHTKCLQASQTHVFFRFSLMGWL